MNDNTRGPFRNVSIPDELYTVVGSDDTGRPYRRLRLETATQLFLEAFSPANGWAVNIASEVMEMDMRAYDERNSNTSPLYPVVRFVATLSNPSGVPVASASTLWVIKEATAWEKGETNARLRLYAATGLSVTRSGEGAAAQLPAANQDANPLGDVRPRAYTGREDVRNTTSPQPAPGAPATPDVTDGHPGSRSTDSSPNDQSEDASKVENGSVISGESNQATPATSQADASSKPGKRNATRNGDRPPSPSILRTIETLCKNLKREVPELKTMAEARNFHHSLLNGG